jgi:hypothetical protein
MSTATRDYPAGDLRVCDADRDRALAELSDAFQAGRITAEEFDQRSRRALDSRTGNDLMALLADLPHDRGCTEAALTSKAHREVAKWTVIGTSAAAATSLAALAVANALSRPAPPALRSPARSGGPGARRPEGLAPGAPASPGFDWAGTITPAAIAVLLVAVIVVVQHVARASQGEPGR